MSWLFSQALAAEFLAVHCSDGEPSVRSNVNHTPQAYWSLGKTTDCCPRFPSGMTCEHLTADRGAELLTSYLAASRARTSARPGKEPESTASAAVYGANLQGSFTKYDRDSSSWKTAQCSLGGGLDEFSETWPRSGSMRNGACYLQPPLALRTCATGYGLWPTPTCDAAKNRRSRYAQGGMPLTAAVSMWPTIRKSDAERGGRGDLLQAVRGNRNKHFATPTATMSKGWSAGHKRANTDDRIDYTIEREASAQGKRGRLNPLWVAWLMGWPIGWTDLKPLATDRFREWRRQHGKCFANGEVGDEA